MNLPRFIAFDRRLRGGFTLIELITVMAIMALLLAVTVPSIEGLNLGAGISQGGQLFTDEVSLARQMASARNITVQLRCIKVPTRGKNGYTAMQLWAPTSGTAISRLATMPEGIAISQDTTRVSPLFATFSSTGVMATGGPVAGDTYVAFTINPSGMVGPVTTTGTEPTMTATSVGVVAVSHAADTTLPTNYVIIQLNPLTAATVAYRP